MSSEVNGVNVSADNVFVCIKITYWVRVRRPRQATAPTYSKNAAPLDQPPLPRKNPRSAPAPTVHFYISIIAQSILCRCRFLGLVIDDDELL